MFGVYGMNVSLLLLILICFIGMISPGPDFYWLQKCALIPQTPSVGYRFGIVSGCLFHATYCILGLALIITQSSVIFITVKYAGACYLIYLGFKSLSSKKMKKYIQIFLL